MDFKRRLLVLAPCVLAVGCAHGPEARGLPIRRQASLSAVEIEARLREADALCGEPRTAERTARSLEVSLDAVSPQDEQGALWRAARACAWLAEHHPSNEERLLYAETGAAIGEEALASAPAGPEPYFYQALNLGFLSELGGGGFFRIGRMKELAKQVIAADERFEHAGGHRFLGKLCAETSGIPFAAAGTLEDALHHLRRACELFPGHGQNQLFLAEVLIRTRKPDEARVRLKLVRESAPPAGESVDHAAWVARAQELLAGAGDE